MPSKRSVLPFGSVSVGTMREDDLIPVFLWAADHLTLTRDERKTVNQIKRASGFTYDQNPIYWNEAAMYDLETLWDILEHHCPPYAYFGAHPGDGADYGVWLYEGFDQDFDGLRVSDLSQVPTGYTGEVLSVNDHGNMSLYAYSRGRGRVIW